MKSKIKHLGGIILISLLVSLLVLSPAAAASHGMKQTGRGPKPFIGKLSMLTMVASTVPANGDVNPYGLVMITKNQGKLMRGDLLVSNFNNSANLQGTGSTLVEISPAGKVDLFAQIDPKTLPSPCPGGVGLTTALAVLPSGWVIVGSLPTSDGTSNTAMAGCLIVLNSSGKVAETITGDFINGPWDMVARQEGDQAFLFVANVLNGTLAASPMVVNMGNVVRIELDVPEGHESMPAVVSHTVIASGFPERTDPMALVIGPTGLGLSNNGTLYIADTLDNRIAAVDHAMRRSTDAGTGVTLAKGGAINNPLGLTVAQDGDILVVNGGDGNLVDINRNGMQVAVKMVTSGGGGALFGVVVTAHPNGVYFVDDSNNTLNLFH